MHNVKKLDILCNKKIDVFFKHFGCRFVKRSTKLVGSCPVHGGDNRMAFNYYRAGYWKCRTHCCHQQYCSTPIGLIRGLLSKKEGRSIDFSTTLKFICKCLDTNFKDIEFLEIEEPIIIRTNTNLNLDITELSNRLILPCPYYSTKFDKEIVERQMIGFCDTPGRFFNKRSVVPILDRSGTKIIACQGRSIHEECPICHSYHENGQCPSYFYPKWKTSTGFATDMFLYNYWVAKKHISRPKTLFLTESVGNTLRLMEFDINNAVASFGTQFSNFQKEMILNSGAETIIYIRDAGLAGEKSAERAKAVLGDSCIVPELPIQDDIAKTPKLFFEQRILPLLKEWI